MRAPDRAARCADPECGQVAEPEQDGDLHYWACTGCGYTFGFIQITQPFHADSDGTCSVGVPETIRRAASAPMHRALGPLHSIGIRDGNPAS